MEKRFKTSDKLGHSKHFFVFLELENFGPKEQLVAFLIKNSFTCKKVFFPDLAQRSLLKTYVENFNSFVIINF